MNPNEEIIQAYLDQKESLKQQQTMQLRANLKTFTLEELKKEMIKMRADKLAVIRKKRKEVIDLIIESHYLFPHLLTILGTKGQPKPKKVGTKRKAKYNPKTLAKLAQQVLNPRPTQISRTPKKSTIPTPSIKVTPEIMPNLSLNDLQGMPPEMLAQLIPK